jgi:XTP/dITP diphosphohydrolase
MKTADEAPRYPTVVLGSRNAKKIGEIRELLAPYQIPLVGVTEFSHVADVVEDGDSFLANATKKACETAMATQHWTIAEDSGLCVDALGGQPGIYSARFAGEQGNDAANNARLLERLADVTDGKRTAYYICVAVLADPQGQVLATSEGRCGGCILRDYQGSHGFGYDPLFLVREYHQTFGQLSPAVKRHISHRAKAFERLIPRLCQLLPRA